MIFEGYIVKLNDNELKKIERTANNAANNINQIAIRANSSGNVYPEILPKLRIWYSNYYSSIISKEKQLEEYLQAVK